MIEEQATVVEVASDQFTVQTLRQSSCKSCSANKACGTGVLAKTIGQKHSIVSIPKNASEQPELQPGDQVIIGINENMLLSGSMLAYLLPLALMFMFAILAMLAGNYAQLSGEWHIILAAISGLISGLFFSRRYLTAGANSADFAPVLVRKLQQVTPVRDNILLP